jgi:hypothetical protein
VGNCRIELRAERSHRRRQKHAIHDESHQLPALSKVWFGRDGSIQQNRGQANLEHVAGSEIRGGQEVKPQGEIGGKIDDKTCGEVGRPLTPGRAQQDSQQKAIGWPQDRDATRLPAMQVQHQRCDIETAQRQHGSR